MDFVYARCIYANIYIYIYTRACHIQMSKSTNIYIYIYIYPWLGPGRLPLRILYLSRVTCISWIHLDMSNLYIRRPDGRRHSSDTPICFWFRLWTHIWDHLVQFEMMFVTKVPRFEHSMYWPTVWELPVQGLQSLGTDFGIVNARTRGLQLGGFNAAPPISGLSIRGLGAYTLGAKSLGANNPGTSISGLFIRVRVWGLQLGPSILCHRFRVCQPTTIRGLGVTLTWLSVIF